MEHEEFHPEEYEPIEQPALPRRTGTRSLRLVLIVLIVLVSATVSIVSLAGSPDSARKLVDDGAVRPTVVGTVERDLTANAVDSALAIDESSDGVLSLREIYERTIDAVVCVQTGSAVGTGVIMTDDGYIITNYHVIEGARSFSVLLMDDRTFDAALIGSDEQSDLAVLKIEADHLTAATFGDSDTLAVGDTVVAIGNPLGTELRGTMTDGIVSAINRDITIDGREMTVIQTNAALNSGNSGGPLLNAYGQVVGINTAKFQSYSIEGIGFAIPIATVKPIVDELISLGYVTGRPTLGVTGEAVPQYAQIYYRLPDGVYVAAIDESSDTYRQGVREGDVIVAVGETRVTGTDELTTAINHYEPGDLVELTIYRSGAYYKVSVTLDEQGA
jgi:serine protease Do